MFIIILLFDIFIYGVTLVSEWTFFLAFLHKSEIWLLKVNLESNLTPKNFSVTVFYNKIFYSYIDGVVCANTWHLITLLSSRLSLNHLNNLVEFSSKDLTAPSMLFALTYDVLSLA